MGRIALQICLIYFVETDPPITTCRTTQHSNAYDSNTATGGGGSTMQSVKEHIPGMPCLHHLVVTMLFLLNFCCLVAGLMALIEVSTSVGVLIALEMIIMVCN